MSLSDRMSQSRVPVRMHSTMEIIGKSIGSQSETESYSEQTSIKSNCSHVLTKSKISSNAKSRAKSLSNLPTDSEIALEFSALVISNKKSMDIHKKTDEIKLISSEEKTEQERCPICLDDFIEAKQLDKCSHRFCTDCIDIYFRNIKPQCPCCFTIYGEIRGNQPETGEMHVCRESYMLPGYEQTSKGTIRITYVFPDGIQDERHANPGIPYYGTVREAYLPDNNEGEEVLALLQRSFEFRQTFTVGQSRTTGCDNVVTWNDIHHKTSIHGGMENFGYPDHTYLNRVRQELAAKGIK